jgi:hypothetical protein
MEDRAMKPSRMYQIIMATARSAGEESMRKSGRRAWNRDDYQACWDELERLCPEPAEQARAAS